MIKKELIELIEKSSLIIFFISTISLQNDYFMTFSLVKRTIISMLLVTSIIAYILCGQILTYIIGRSYICPPNNPN